MPSYNNNMLGDEQIVKQKQEQPAQMPTNRILEKQLSALPRSNSIPKTGFSGNKPAVLEKGPLRFVITDSPSDSNISHHVQDLKKLKVKHVCRASEPTYSTQPLQESGIKVHDLAFPDGDPPPENVLRKWLKLVENCFIKRFNGAKVRGVSGEELEEQLKQDERISVHCVAGLGRAPVLVAVALVEFCNLDALDAVTFIRQHRRGAINKKQLKWLEEYVPRKKSGCASCVVS